MSGVPTSTEEMSYVLEDTVISIFLFIYGAILVFGTFMCALLTLALFRGRKTLFQWPFFRIVQNLVHLDAVFLLVQLCLIFPSMITDDLGIGPVVDDHDVIQSAKAWYNSKVVKAVLRVLEFLPLKGLLYLSLLMALNRLAVFTFPALKVVFDKESIFWTLIGCWAIIDVLCIMSVLVRPMQRFNRTSLRFEDSGEILLEAPELKIAIDMMDYSIPFLIIAIYVLIFLSIRKKRQMISSSTTGSINHVDDTRMLWQAIFIAIFLQLYNCMSIVADYVDEDDLLGYILNMLDLIFIAANHTIHSTIFILTNATIRSFLPKPVLLQKLACCKKKIEKPATVENTNDNTGENAPL